MQNEQTPQSIAAAKDWQLSEQAEWFVSQRMDQLIGYQGHEEIRQQVREWAQRFILATELEGPRAHRHHEIQEKVDLAFLALAKDLYHDGLMTPETVLNLHQDMRKLYLRLLAGDPVPTPAPWVLAEYGDHSEHICTTCWGHVQERIYRHNPQVTEVSEATAIRLLEVSDLCAYCGPHA